MAKLPNEQNIIRIKISTWATFQGSFAAILGLAIAILHSLESVVLMAEETNSVVRGMAFGLATGIVSIIVLPIIYFAVGWLIGIVQAWIFNTVLGISGGITIETDRQK